MYQVQDAVLFEQDRTHPEKDGTQADQARPAESGIMSAISNVPTRLSRETYSSGRFMIKTTTYLPRSKALCMLTCSAVKRFLRG